MSLENKMLDALSSLVGRRVSPVIFGQPDTLPTWPAIRYTFISVVPSEDICGDDDDQTADARVQLDVVAVTFKAARALRLQVMGAMKAAFPSTNPATADSPVAILQNTSNDYDTETKTYREILDYVFYGSSASGNSPP